MAATVKYKDFEIHLSSKYKGKAKPWEGDREMDAHKVLIKIGNVQIETDYYCHEKRLNAEELRYVLYLHLSDGISFKNAGSLNEFFREFGYGDNPEAGIKAYEGCKQAWFDWKVFNIDPYKIADWLQEKYDF